MAVTRKTKYLDVCLTGRNLDQDLDWMPTTMPVMYEDVM